MCTTGQGHCPCRAGEAAMCLYPLTSSPTGGALSAATVWTPPAGATPHPQLWKHRVASHLGHRQVTQTIQHVGVSKHLLHENMVHVLRHSPVSSSDRRQLTLLWEAEVDHLRGDGRAQVEVSQHILHWFVWFHGWDGGVAQCLLSEESNNNSNQWKLLKNKTDLLWEQMWHQAARFLVPVIQSYFGAVLMVILYQTDKISAQFLALTNFWWTLNRMCDFPVDLHYSHDDLTWPML